MSTYVQQASDPATLVDEVAVYAKDASGVEELFLRRESSGTVIRMTKGDPITAATGETFIPGGFIIKWGSAAITNSSQTWASLGLTAFPTACYSMYVTSSNILLTSPLTVTAISSTAFTISRSGSGNTGYYFFAIGN